MLYSSIKPKINTLLISLLSAFSGFFLFGVSHAAVISPDLQQALLAAGADGRVPVIINLAGRVDLSKIPPASANGIIKHDKTSRREAMIRALKDKASQTQFFLKALLRDRGAGRVTPFWITNSIAASIPAAVVSELMNLPEVESITLDAVVQPPPIVPASFTVPLWNISRINAPVLWKAGIAGSGMVVANLDTGVDVTHPDLKPKWRGGACASPPDCNSWFDPHTNSILPYDQSGSRTGHGTGTMGVMVGESATDAYGVAPNAKWIAAKIFNDSGVAFTSDIISALQWVLMPGGNPANAPDVVNNSWGFDTVGCTYDPALDTAIQNVEAAGIAVVFSAGNSGWAPSTSISPANYPGIFSVGATDSTDLIASFSSRGPSACDGGIFPRVVAPGVGIYTSSPADTYRSWDGTSFAAPHVAGAMALLANAFPSLTPADISGLLEQTAVPLPPAGTVPNDDYGYGLIDLAAAYRTEFIALNGDIPHIAAVPSSLQFDDTQTGYSSPSSILMIANQGTSGLLIDASPGGVQLTGTNASDFVINSDGCSGVALPALESCLVSISFSPATTGPKTASLVVSSSDAAMPSLSVSLSGNGVTPYNVALVRNGTTIGTFPTIQMAYDSAAHLDIIKMRNTVFTENPDLNSSDDISISLLGGYASGFGVKTGDTTIQGSLTISRGSVTVGGVILQ